MATKNYYFDSCLRLSSKRWMPFSLVNLALLTACGTPLPHERPALDVPAAYKQGVQGSAVWQTAQPQDSVPSAWWTLFADPALNALQERAASGNQNVALAVARLRAARAALDSAGAAGLPSLGATASSTRSRSGTNAESSAQARTRNSQALGLNASWELDLWGRKRNLVQAGQENLAATQASLYAAHVSLSAEVALHYIQLRNAQERLRIAQHNLALQAQTEQMTRWRVQAGLAASLDAEQARQTLAQTAAQIPSLQASVRQTQHALAVLTGQAPAALLEALAQPAPVPAAPPTWAMRLPADTLRQRPDVQAQEHRVQAALANLSAQERANFPTLRLSGSLGVGALTLGALSDGASVARSIAASLAAPIFDAGANRAQIAAQQAAVVQARQAYRSSVLAALQEVEDALVQLQSDQQRLVHVQVAAEAAGNAQRLAQQRYDSGLIDFRTVLESQRSLLSSQDSLASAQAAISTDVVKLFKALGGGWTKENNQLTEENLILQAVSATE